MKRNILLFISTFFLAQFGSTQTVWKAELPVVEKSDYYNIELSQELIGAGLQYLKILDENNNEVPYFIRLDNPVQEISNFESFDLKENITKDSLNIIVVDNKTHENLNRFCIVIQRAETKKYIYIRGSNDRSQWYIVKQQSEIPEFPKQTGENTEMLIVDFPQGNYRYYEITLWNNQKNPLEVLKVGKIKNSNLYGNFTAIDFGKLMIANDDSAKNSTISFPELKHIYLINRIEFSIKNRPDYHRRAALIDSTRYNQSYFYLSSENDNVLFFNDFPFSSQTFILIENRNNPSLVIDSIGIYGLSRYACAYLEAGQKFGILSDSNDKIFSSYDIEHFRNKIPAELTLLKIKNQSYYTSEGVSLQRALKFIEKPLFLWSTLIVVGAFLVFICVWMMKGMKKKTTLD